MRDSFYVAPGTMRTHVKSIYRKLGVSSRKEAVDEAHAGGLI
jgi:ATP/maltotriose-dependent transcriptional regulator MalT